MVVVVILCAAALLCALASAWHSNTDANVTPAGVLMPGAAGVSVNITITYLRDTTDYQLLLSTNLAGQVWTEKLAASVLAMRADRCWTAQKVREPSHGDDF